MLDVAVKFLVKELNAYLLTRTGSSFGEVEVCKLVDDSGKWTVKDDHIGAALINVEEERILKSHLPEPTYTDGRHVVLEPALKLNLHILFAARFQQYDQALRFLSFVLMHFQVHPVFTPTHFPGLDPRIEKLSAELLSLNYEQLNQVWAFIGGKQLPSVVYKIRMVTLQDPAQRGIEKPFSQSTTVLHAQ